MSDLDDLEEIAEQSSFRVNDGHPKVRVRLGRVTRMARFDRVTSVFANAKHIKKKPVTLPDRA